MWTQYLIHCYFWVWATSHGSQGPREVIDLPLYRDQVKNVPMVQFSLWGLGVAPEATRGWVLARFTGQRPWEVAGAWGLCFNSASSLLGSLGQVP